MKSIVSTIFVLCSLTMPTYSANTSIPTYDKEKAKTYKEIAALASTVSSVYGVPSREAKEYVTLIHENTLNKRASKLLVLAVVGVESKFRNQSISKAGAIGLMQVMPKYHGVQASSLKNPKVNVAVGTRVLNEKLRKSKGNICNALQMYNGSLDDSTRMYSKLVALEFNKLARKVSSKRHLSC